MKHKYIIYYVPAFGGGDYNDSERSIKVEGSYWDMVRSLKNIPLFIRVIGAYVDNKYYMIGESFIMKINNDLKKIHY